MDAEAVTPAAPEQKKTPLDAVVEHFGSVGALAEKLEITREAIYRWNGKIPKPRVYQIAMLSMGKFSVDFLSGAE